MTLRTYIPQVGKQVKMREWNDYTSRGINMWAWLKVIAVTDGTVSFQVMNGSQETNHFSACPVSAIQAPLGWKPRYTIYCKPEQADMVLSWFSRGIVVRTNHDMSSSSVGCGAFTPMDSDAHPGWQYPEVTDIIPAELCASLIRVVLVKTEEITSATLNFPADPKCTHCNGTGRRSLSELANIRNQTLEQVQTLVDNGEIPLDNLTDGTFRCLCHYNVMSHMGRTVRGKLFKAMRTEGWSVRYVPYAGGFWERQKETIVHDWKV